MIHRLALLVLCLLATPALAEEGFNLDDLLIPEDLGPKGRDGLAKFFGRPVVVKDGKWKGIFNFSAEGRVAWTRANGKTLRGHFGDSAYGDEMCFDFGFSFNDCFYVQQQGNALNLQVRDSGKPFTARADEGVADDALPTADRTACEPMKTILTAGAQGKLEDLTDPQKEPFQVNAFVDESYWTTVSFGNTVCTYETMGLGPSIDCAFRFDDEAPQAEKLYEAFVGQTRACQKDKIQKADIDPQVWLRYSEIDFEKKSTKKISKERFHPLKTDFIRRSSFSLANKMQIDINLSYRSICRDAIDCDLVYGVWTSFSRRK